MPVEPSPNDEVMMGPTKSGSRGENDRKGVAPATAVAGSPGSGTAGGAAGSDANPCPPPTNVIRGDAARAGATALIGTVPVTTAPRGSTPRIVIDPKTGAALNQGESGTRAALGTGPAAQLTLPEHAVQHGDAVRFDTGAKAWTKVDPTTGAATHRWAPAGTGAGQWVTVGPDPTAPGGAPSASALRTTIRQFEKRETPAVASLPAPTGPVPSAPPILDDKRRRASTPGTVPTATAATPSSNASSSRTAAAPAADTLTMVSDPSGRRWTAVKDAAGTVRHYVALDPVRGNQVYAWSAAAKAFVLQPAGSPGVMHPPIEVVAPVGAPAPPRAPAPGLPGPRQ